MNSCLYECLTVHARMSPKKYRLSQKLFFFYLDLAEIPELSGKLRRMGKDRLYEFRDTDHFPGVSTSCGENILRFAREQGYEGRPARITILTHLRMFGFVFNPVSFYFLLDADGQARAAVAEVGNTFGEQKLYYLGPADFKNGIFQAIRKKYYYISPFSDLDTELHFHLAPPGEDLAIRIDETQNGEKFFFATLAGKRRELTDKNLLRYVFRYPFMTLAIPLAIHWHAFRLWLLGVPHHRKESNPELQRGAVLVQKAH